MASAATVLQISDLPARQASALKRKAARLGLSAGEYVKRLIEEDLELDRVAQIQTLDQLAAPFRRALSGASEVEIELIVAKGRSSNAASGK